MKPTRYRTGLRAEALCRLALRLKLYRIIASRYRSRLGEIDIIAARGKVLALIEVKARPTNEEALQAVSPQQRERLQRAALDFLAHHPQFNHHIVRFDIMMVSPHHWPRHVPDAWRVML